MPSELLSHFRAVVSDQAFTEVRILRVEPPVKGSDHPYKYSLALVVDGTCVMRYDNERRKGDHRHENGVESPYEFSALDALYADFLADVRRLTDGY